MKFLALPLLLLSPPFLKRYILKWLIGAEIGVGARIGWFSAVVGGTVVLGDHSEIRAFSLIHCSGGVEVGAYSVVSNMVLVYGSASLKIGQNCYIGPQSLLNVDEDIRLGNRSALGPRCMVFTHGSFLPYTEGYWVRFGGVTIGDRVWIAAGVFIHPGVEIGDDVFVNSRSVLAKSFGPGQVIEGYPAKAIARMQHVKRRMTPKRIDHTARQMLGRFVEAVLRNHHGLVVRELGPASYSFRYRLRTYVIELVPSVETTGAGPEPEAVDRRIVLLNRTSWVDPGNSKRVLRLDLQTLTTPSSKDPIHNALCRFLRSYFGVTFDLE